MWWWSTWCCTKLQKLLRCGLAFSILHDIIGVVRMVARNLMLCSWLLLHSDVFSLQSARSSVLFCVAVVFAARWLVAVDIDVVTKLDNEWFERCRIIDAACSTPRSIPFYRGAVIGQHCFQSNASSLAVFSMKTLHSSSCHSCRVSLGHLFIMDTQHLCVRASCGLTRGCVVVETH